MATVLDNAKCVQCGYEWGDHDYNCRTGEWWFGCRRCGYGESLDWIADDEGNRIGWRHDTLDGHGAVWATRTDNGVSTFYGLRSAPDVERAAQKMRDSIAKGELDVESSYVTRWNADAKRADIVAGKWCETRESVQ
jgi:hypothetical protein